jgi:hypothetical protein
MRRILLCVALPVLVAAAGCAATAVQVDEAYMARVEHAARVAGIQVVWLNPPRRTVASTPN